MSVIAFIAGIMIGFAVGFMAVYYAYDWHTEDENGEWRLVGTKRPPTGRGGS